MSHRVGWVGIWLWLSSSLPSAPIDFATQVVPLLREHCYACHGPDVAEGGLRFDSRAIVQRGGDSGLATIVPGDHAASRLWQLVSGEDPDLSMPPVGEGDSLSPLQIGLLAAWIDEGAAWPDERAGYDPEATARQHWSFQPFERPAVPQSGSPWVTNAIDEFILAQLHERGLTPSPLATRETFLRRLYVDTLGVLPTPAEVAAFSVDRRTDAVVHWVDRVLSDSRYGERWAQHWLDIVRYADTDGFEVNTPRPHAWPYRDYVIDAFNRDVPYDRFVLEQLCGDQLGIDPATGFLVCAAALLPGQIGQDELSKRIARQDELDEIVSGTCSTLLGLTVGCARCHHHKFDPISQHDYYGMQAVFSGVKFGEREWTSELYRREAPPLLEELSRIRARLSDFGFLEPVNAQENHERFAPRPVRFVRFTVHATNNLEPCLDELEVLRVRDADPNASRVNVALADRGGVATSSGNYADASTHKLEQINDGQYGNSRSWISSQTGAGWVQIELAHEEIVDEIVWQRDRHGKFQDRLPTQYTIEVASVPGHWTVVASSALRLTDAAELRGDTLQVLHERLGADFTLDQQTETAGLLRRRADLLRRLSQLQSTLRGTVFAGKFATPETVHVLLRGDVQQPQAVAIPTCVSMLGKLPVSNDASDAQRRHAFAQWVIEPQNPLTARVMINRLWHYHFGRGFVDTPSDFGAMGARPTHPQLLNWLACELMDHGWSIKHIQRQILLSSTYAQSHHFREEAAAVDADDRWLWRFPPRRMEAEVIRDCLLMVSGELNGQRGGPGFSVFQSRGGLNGFPPIEEFGPEGLRRMIYVHKIRMERDAVFGAFDCPDAGQSCPKRTRSTTPLQALNMMNSPFVLARAERFAERVVREQSDNLEAQVRQAMRIAIGRDPHHDELPLLLEVAESDGLVAVCRALLNTNEFLMIP